MLGAVISARSPAVRASQWKDLPLAPAHTVMLMSPTGPQNSGLGTEQGGGGIRVLRLCAPATRRCLRGPQALAVGDRLLLFQAHSEQSCCQH